MSQPTHITIPVLEHEALLKDHRDAADMRATLAGIEMLLHAAAKCGFTDKNQEDAVCLALQRITGQPIEVVRATLHITPKGYHGRS